MPATKQPTIKASGFTSFDSNNTIKYHASLFADNVTFEEYKGICSAVRNVCSIYWDANNSFAPNNTIHLVCDSEKVLNAIIDSIKLYAKVCKFKFIRKR